MAEPLQENPALISSASESPSVPNAEASSPQQQPPPADNASTIWTRRTIIFAFWAVVAALGLPHWIWTTSIHREELPVERMGRWAEGGVSVLVLCLPRRSNAVY